MRETNHGSATDMVRAMAQEMGDDVSPHDCIDFLCSHLARAGRLSIRIPDGPIEFRSNLFIRSLLATGIALPVPSA